MLKGLFVFKWNQITNLNGYKYIYKIETIVKEFNATVDKIYFCLTVFEQQKMKTLRPLRNMPNNPKVTNMKTLTV